MHRAKTRARIALTVSSAEGSDVHNALQEPVAANMHRSAAGVSAKKNRQAAAASEG
jgi:hypothetical protein